MGNAWALAGGRRAPRELRGRERRGNGSKCGALRGPRCCWAPRPAPVCAGPRGGRPWRAASVCGARRRAAGRRGRGAGRRQRADGPVGARGRTRRDRVGKLAAPAGGAGGACPLRRQRHSRCVARRTSARWSPASRAQALHDRVRPVRAAWGIRRIRPHDVCLSKRAYRAGCTAARGTLRMPCAYNRSPARPRLLTRSSARPLTRSLARARALAWGRRRERKLRAAAIFKRAAALPSTLP